jgi:hypothetical protein
LWLLNLLEIQVCTIQNLEHTMQLSKNKNNYLNHQKPSYFELLQLSARPSFLAATTSQVQAGAPFFHCSNSARAAHTHRITSKLLELPAPTTNFPWRSPTRVRDLLS